MEKLWLKSYPAGVPAEINPDAYQSITEIFNISCRNYQNRPAFTNFGKTLTYGEIDQASRDFAAYLQNVLNLKKGDRIAIMMPNLLQYPIAMFGALRAGLIVVNVNPLYTAHELAHQMNDSGAETIVAVTNFASTIEKALPSMPKLKNVILTNMVDMLPLIKGTIMHLVIKYHLKMLPEWNIPKAIMFKQILATGKNLPYEPVAIANTDTAFLQYTGGTTGVSKGAELSHRNIVANIQQADAWFKSCFSDQNETIITALPLYHIFSLTANCLYFTKIGGSNILITNPRDIPGFVKTLRKTKFTIITGVNTLFNGLLKHPDFAKVDFSQLRVSLGGGMAVQKVVATRWKAVTGCLLLEAYGLTETSPCVTINPPDLAEFNGTVGLPVPSTDVKIVDPDGNELPIGEAGELVIKGPQVMRAYWNNPAETAKVFTKDGWLLTGDIAMINEQGFVKILERKKDLILVSGFNVYPNEVEDVISRLPGVREVAVIAIPNENSGEVPKAFIVLDDEALTKADIIKHCRENLTPYKIPREIEFIAELPKTNVGKILRRALRT